MEKFSAAIAKLESESTAANANRMLAEGCRYFNVDFGIVSHIQPPRYTVLYVYAPSDIIRPGTEFDFTETYCEITYSQDGILSVTDFSKSQYNTHPCYKAFGLETYFGVPLYKNRKVMGTLNFSSPKSRQPFSDTDTNLLQQAAHAIEKLF